MNKNIYESIKSLTNLKSGIYETNLDSVRVFYSDENIPKKHIPYDSSVIIIFNGNKVGYIKGKELHYNADNYLVISTSLPFECQSFGSLDDPLIGMIIDIDMLILQDIWSKLDVDTFDYGIKKSANVGIAEAYYLSKDMKNIAIRLLIQLQDKETSRILGKGTIKELFYNMLISKQSSPLYALADKNSKFSKIVNTLDFVNQNISNNIKIDQMAKMSNMSSPTFHRVFKKLIGDSPIQFIKKARLSKARNLIEYQGMGVSIVAQEVGYESVSQFSREFKRLFGVSPKNFIHDSNKNLSLI